MRVGGAYIFLYSAKWLNGDEKSQKKKKRRNKFNLCCLSFCVFTNGNGWKKLRFFAFTRLKTRTKPLRITHGTEKKHTHELMKIHWSISGSYCQRKCMNWLIYLLHGHLKGAECSKLQISVCSARIVFVSISMQGSSGLRVIHRLAQWQCD